VQELATTTAAQAQSPLLHPQLKLVVLETDLLLLPLHLPPAAALATTLKPPLDLVAPRAHQPPRPVLPLLRLLPLLIRRTHSTKIHIHIWYGRKGVVFLDTDSLICDCQSDGVGVFEMWRVENGEID
jgi:hypothetical protein